MVKFLYLIRDKKAGFTGAIALYENDGLAVRDFANLVKQPSTLQHNNPEDFSLIKIGSFNTDTAELISFADYEVIAKATSYSDVRNEVIDNDISDPVQEN